MKESPNTYATLCIGKNLNTAIFFKDVYELVTMQQVHHASL